MKILSRLLNNCRKPDRQIGMELGISGGAVGSRINKMEKLGIIEKFCLKVEPPLLGLNMFYIVVNSQNQKEIIKNVKVSWNAIYSCSMCRRKYCHWRYSKRRHGSKKLNFYKN